MHGWLVADENRLWDHAMDALADIYDVGDATISDD
jgi:hypothetical protein